MPTLVSCASCLHTVHCGVGQDPLHPLGEAADGWVLGRHSGVSGGGGAACFSRLPPAGSSGAGAGSGDGGSGRGCRWPPGLCWEAPSGAAAPPASEGSLGEAAGDEAMWQGLLGLTEAVVLVKGKGSKEY